MICILKFLGKCIYGVEANPTTVAIAKHNIWLATLSVGAPFSFLDHHLRRGNALMGTLVRDDFGPDCQPIQDYLAEGVIKALKKLPDTKSQLVTGRWNARQYEVFHNAIEPYHVMLDLSILTSLGHSATRELINRYSSDTGAVYLDPKTKNLTAGIDFFHWDLEFPEIFLEEIKGAVNKDAGFHAVISMPISRLSMNDIKHSEKYLTTHFPTVESLKNTNWYRFAQGLRLLTDSGYLAMVIDQRAFITKSDPLEKVLKRLIDSNN